MQLPLFYYDGLYYDYRKKLIKNQPGRLPGWPDLVVTVITSEEVSGNPQREPDTSQGTEEPHHLP